MRSVIWASTLASRSVRSAFVAFTEARLKSSVCSTIPESADDQMAQHTHTTAHDITHTHTTHTP